MKQLVLAIVATTALACGGVPDVTPDAFSGESAAATGLTELFFRTYLTERLGDDFAGRTLTPAFRAKADAETGYDPYLCTQDVLDDWKTHVAVDPATVDGAAAATHVTLGTQSPHVLGVRLKKVDGAWRIDDIECPAP